MVSTTSELIYSQVKTCVRCIRKGFISQVWLASWPDILLLLVEGVTNEPEGYSLIYLEVHAANVLVT